MLEAHGLCKTFITPAGPLQAVRDVSFTVNKGELVGLIGPNGAGKSTTMRLLAGYLPPDTGTVSLCGHPMAAHRAEAQACLGYLAEQPALYEDLLGAEYLDFIARAHNVPNRARAIGVVAQLTRCDGFLHRPLGELSKGMKQRVHLAAALVNDPAVLILDEPTDGLDPNQKHELRLTLRELAKTKAVLVSTHILEEAEAMCSRVLIINQGKLIADTTPAELARQGKGDIQLAFRILTLHGKKAAA
ncbi:MAG: ABC transporter ATP-binding protein [Pseudomonadaceae bacterium]|nr:ABC transporter ATP-binding protein [Pseudomonadaceae bacterium]